MFASVAAPCYLLLLLRLFWCVARPVVVAAVAVVPRIALVVLVV